MKNNITSESTNEELMGEIKQFYTYYKSNFKDAHSEKSLEIDLNELINISPKLHEALLSSPKEVLNLLEIGLEEIFIGQNKKIRLKNLNNSVDIHKIRVRDLNHIFNIKGIIKRVTKVIPRTEMIRYRCAACGAVIGVQQTARKKEEPRRCSCGAKKTRFIPENEEIKNIQELNLEEIQESLEGKQPQQLRVYLEDELTDGSLCARLQPGRRIEVIGIIEKLPTFMTVRDEETNLSEFMLYANNVISLDAEDDLTITLEDEIKIKEIAKNNPLQKLADSLIPEVYGNDMIKKALILQTIKGVAKEKSDGTFSREDINILLVGDLGVAKSVSLKAVTTRVPKSKMIVGTKTSRVGLGAMCVKDELTQNWALEIGPLILCNGGELCIDELDKMYKEHLNDLLEPMSSSCYDDKTEILTENGWKFFKELNKGEKVATLEFGKLVYREPSTYIIKDYKGPMISIKSEKVNLLITPNHNLYTSVHKWGTKWFDYNLKRADSCYGKHQKFKRIAKWDGEYKETFILPSINKRLNHTKKFRTIKEKEIPMNLWLEFLGYYLSEGSFNSGKNGTPYRIAITQSKERNKKKFKRCLDSLGFKYIYRRGNFTICGKQLASYLSQFGKAKDKHVPKFIKNLNKKQISLFLEAIMLGDGHTRNKGGKSLTRAYYTISKRLADDVQELLLKIGISGNIYSRFPITKKIGNREFKKINLEYTVSWIVKNNVCEVKSNHFLLEEYNGKIYCVEVPNHIIYVRRNGIPIWCGNTVTITKAGIHACLPARTSILASANPIYGNYDLTQPLAKQIDLPSPILNRFDLIFIMIDRPNEDFDSKAVEHIFKSYKEKMVSEIPTDLFKKYIIYCKKLKPILADNLLDHIQEFYISLREKSKRPEVKAIPVNLRNMEALVKLAEAHAKLRLSSIVEVGDLNIAKGIFMFCINQIGIDEDTGAIDISRSFEKMPLSKRAKMEKFLEMIYNLIQDDKDAELLYTIIIEEGKKIGMKSWETNIFLETLQKENKIYEPRRGIYKIVPEG